MRILGIVASAFSAVVQKIYTWSHSFIWTGGSFFAYQYFAPQPESLKYIAINPTGDVLRRSTLLSSTSSTTQNSIFSSTNPAASIVTGRDSEMTVMVACGNDTTRSQQFKHTSPDTTAWTTVTDTSSPSFDRKGGIWDITNERFIFCSNTSGSSGRLISLSKSGGVWSPTSNIVSSSIRVNDIAYNENSGAGAAYIVVPLASGTTVFYHNGTTLNSWTSQTVSSTSRAWRSVAYGNGIWVLIGTGTVFATSTDGITWTERAWNQGSSRPDSFTQVRFVNDRFVTSLRSSTGTVLVSTSFDGITWEFFNVGDLDTFSTFFWQYSDAEDIIFASMFDQADTYNISAYITRGIGQ